MPIRVHWLWVVDVSCCSRSSQASACTVYRLLSSSHPACCTPLALPYGSGPRAQRRAVEVLERAGVARLIAP